MKNEVRTVGYGIGGFADYVVCTGDEILLIFTFIFIGRRTRLCTKPNRMKRQSHQHTLIA